MKMKRMLAMVLAMLLCLSSVPMAGVSAAGEELNQYIQDSNIDWDQLKWTKPATDAAGNIFGSASKYALFTFGDFLVDAGAEVTGKLAVGGTFTNNAMNQIGAPNGLGNGITVTYPRNEIHTVVGDHLDGSFSGGIHGWLASAKTSDMGQTTVSFTGDPKTDYKDWYIHGSYTTPDGAKVSDLIADYFAAAKKDLLDAAGKYAKVSVGTVGKTEVEDPAGYPILKLTGTDSSYNVFNVSTAQLNKIKYMKIDIPDNAYAQINVYGGADLNVKLDGCIKKVGGKDVSIISVDTQYYADTEGKDSIEQCSRIFWNMPKVTDITVNSPFPGSVLAPRAKLSLLGGNMNGTIMVDSVYCNASGGEFHFYPFDYSAIPALEDPKPAEPEYIEIPVRKVWAPGTPATDQKPVVIRLMVGEKEVYHVVLDARNGWNHTFTKVQKNYIPTGEPIAYWIQEDPVEGYSGKVTMNDSNDLTKGFTVTNTKVPKTSVTVEKIWEVKTGRKAVVHLLADGVDTGKKVVLTNRNHWTYTFDNLDEKKENGEVISYSVKEDVLQGYTSSITESADNHFTITNTNTETVKVKVQKIWNGTEGDPVQVKLKNGDTVVRTQELNTGNQWKFEFTDLPKYEDDKEIVYTVEEVVPDGYTAVTSGNMKDGFVITNTETPVPSGKVEYREIIVNKKWDGPATDSVTVELRNGNDLAETVTLKAPDWSYRFVVPVKDNGGIEIDYRVEEIVPEGYTSEVTGDMVNGFTITNTNQEKVTIRVTKKWIGPAGDKVTVVLKNDAGLSETSKDLSAANGWSDIFTDLPKYTASGDEILYTVEEVSVAGYQTEITGDMGHGYVITNTNTETIDVSVSKKWVGDAADSITVDLLNGEEVAAVATISGDNQWKHTFTGVPKYDLLGEKITYSIRECALTGYTTAITGNQDEGFVITNTQDVPEPDETVPAETIDIEVSKKWLGKEGKQVTVNLLADGEKVSSQVLNEASAWKTSFQDLPKQNAKGQITYTVTENPVEGYQSSVSGDAAAGFTVTNIETRDIVVDKTWIGLDGREVILHLFGDGKEVASTDFSEKDQWNYIFTDLPIYNPQGEKIEYTLTEENDGSFLTTISGDPDQGFKLLTIKRTVQVTKKWEGGEAEQITVELLANGKTVEEKTITAEDQWQCQFTYLDQYDKDNQEIVYTVKEKDIPGYESKVTGNAEDGFVITNTKVKSPHTGDQSATGVYIAVIAAAAVVIAVLLVKKHKKTK